MSNFTITRNFSSTLTVEIDGETVEIDDTFGEPVDDIVVGPVREDGSRVLTWLLHDDSYDSESPFEVEGVTWDSFRRGDPDRFDGDVGAVNEYLRDNEGRAFLVECYSHGQEIYSLVADHRPYPDRQWDVGIAGILTLDRDFTDPREAAASIVAEYTSWANGDVYGIIVRIVEADGTVRDPGEDCWGYVGYEYAQGEAEYKVGVL